MAKLFKKIFMLFMVITFIFSAFGCEALNKLEKEKISKVEIYPAANEEIFKFERISDLQAYATANPLFNNVYYFVLNTENFYREYNPTYGPPSYAFSYNLDENGLQLNARISVYGDSVYDPNAPKQFRKCGADGAPQYTSRHYYYAYPVNDINKPLTFKHVIIEDSTDVFNRAIRIYQGNLLVGDYIYSPDKADDEYYENFLKENLIIIGGNSSET